jgi:hypothetical protein
MTTSQLQESALGEVASVQFSGRDGWGSRLENAKRDLVQIFHDSIKKYIAYNETKDALKLASGLMSRGEEDKYKEAEKMAYATLETMRSSQWRYDGIASGGRTMARNWQSP